MTSPPHYVPAAYLVHGSLLTSPQLVSLFQDFCDNLGYVRCAPALVFERLVGNLNGAFTSALEAECQKHAEALVAHRDECKALQLSNDILRKELAELKETQSTDMAESQNTNTLIAVKNPIIGSFHTNEVRSSLEPRTRTSRVVTFANRYSTPPGLAMGFTSLNIKNTDNIRGMAYTSKTQEQNFTVHIDTWGGTILPSASCTWLEIEANDLDFQHGTYDSRDDHTWENHCVQNIRLITFIRPYSTPPVVVVWLNQIDLKRDKTYRVKTFATDITLTSFTIHIDTWGDSVLYNARATWIAYPAEKTGISSGRFSTLDMRPQDYPQPKNNGYIKFPSGTFKAPPRTVAALDMIEIDCKHDLRIKVETSNVAEEGMVWHLDSWENTVLYAAGASYIAFI